MKIKICGLSREEDIDYINEARPDYAGFVFAPSKRQVSPVLAARLRLRLAEGIAPVGVFIDAPAADIAALYRDGVISLAQLHGGEDEEYIARLKEASGDTPVPVIKVIKGESLKSLARRHGEHGKYEDLAQGHGGTVEHGEEFYHEPTRTKEENHGVHGEEKKNTEKHGGRKEKETTEYTSNLRFAKHGVLINSSADFYLIDSGAGSGKPFDWNLLNLPRSPLPAPRSLFEKPWFLAGGIGTNNIERAMALKPFGIDVSSGAETDGVKDREKILRLTEIVREGNKG